MPECGAGEHTLHSLGGQPKPQPFVPAPGLGSGRQGQDSGADLPQLKRLCSAMCAANGMKPALPGTETSQEGSLHRFYPRTQWLCW